MAQTLIYSYLPYYDRISAERQLKIVVFTVEAAGKDKVIALVFLMMYVMLRLIKILSINIIITV